VLVGVDSELTFTLPGDDVFAAKQRTGTEFSGLTGLRSGTTANDIWFGVRAGVGVAVQLGDRVTLQAQVQALLYLGHDFNSQRWILGADDSLSVTPMGQGVLAINYGL